MTTYKVLKGTNIQAVSSDPSNPIEGQVWYNTTSNVTKGGAFGAGAFSAGGNLNTGRSQAGVNGTQTSTLAAGGTPPPSGATVTESYNGSSWTEVNDINTGRRTHHSIGVSNTSALAFGGGFPSKNETESWNGSNWTEVNNLNTARAFIAGAGTVTAGLAMGGGPPYKDDTESWNGTNWTEVNDLNSGRYLSGNGAGSQTSAIVAGGGAPSTNNAETWNGTNWTEVNNLNTARNHLTLFGGYSDNTSVIATGGENDSGTKLALSEEWNGTNWTEVADLSTARHYLGAAGTTSAGIVVGGDPALTTTEEWTGAGIATRTFTDS
jgi:hypothetical protein